MAWIEKVTIGYNRTINLGDYNQIKLSMLPTIHLTPEDDVGATLEAMWEFCRRNVEHAAQPILQGYRVGEKHGVTLEEIFCGLPVELQEQHERTVDNVTD